MDDQNFPKGTDYANLPKKDEYDWVVQVKLVPENHYSLPLAELRKGGMVSRRHAS